MATNLADEPLGLSTFPRLRRDTVWINGASRSPLPARTLAVGMEAMRRKAETPWDIGDTTAVADEISNICWILILAFGASMNRRLPARAPELLSNPTARQGGCSRSSWARVRQHRMFA